MGSKDFIKTITTEFNENKNSHVFLIETNDIDKCIVDIKTIIKSVINTDEVTNSQIDDDSYMELITVREETGEIKKDKILELQKRINTKPILSNYKMYIIAPAELLNINSANKLLKTIEEPEEGIIGFLVTTNEDLIIDTIKSRCELHVVLYDSDNDIVNEEIIKYANNFIKTLEEGDLFSWHKEASKISNLKEIGVDIAKEIKKIYTNAGTGINTALDEYLISKNDRKTLIKKAEYINKLLTKLRTNMNSVLLLDLIYIDLKKVK